MVSQEQCRAARAWLGWSQEELAKRAGVGISTLKDFETGKRAPMRNNLEAIQRAIEAEGVSLLFHENGHAIGITASGGKRAQNNPGEARNSIVRI